MTWKFWALYIYPDRVEVIDLDSPRVDTRLPGAWNLVVDSPTLKVYLYKRSERSPSASRGLLEGRIFTPQEPA